MGELEEKIKKGLLKSGFPLQIFCKRWLIRKDWNIIASSLYMVSDDDTRRETDVIGYFEDLDKEPDISYYLYIECKKNQGNPWIFFRDEEPTVKPLLVDVLPEPKPSTKWQTLIAEFIGDLHFNHTASSSIYTVAFRKDKSNQIYDAISSVSSSYQYHDQFRRRIWQEIEAEEGEKTISILVGFLTILFDGKLYLADVEEDDNINLVETNNIIFCQTEVKYPHFRYYTIDVVTRDYFGDYLEVLNKDRELISDFYRREMSTSA